ncbi:MAG: RNA-splicing ligase RtcB [Nitrospiraceae bacterium]|nr:RNA-splicing ligase RtcB [Nitrospiraceae bacterium]
MNQKNHIDDSKNKTNEEFNDFIGNIRNKLKKISTNEFIIPKETRKGMKVDAKIFASDEIISTVEPQALWQLTNAALMPGIVEPVIAMPDIHWGYGVPIGTVAAFKKDEGIISSGMVGFDINCGITLIKSNIRYNEIESRLKEISEALFKSIPAGVGSKSKMRLSEQEIDEIMIDGINWVMKKQNLEEDSKSYEDRGRIEGADPTKVSKEAKKRGMKELGTLGAGNHFLEVQKVDEIYDKKLADKYGLFENQIMVMIHTGSRGFGHQIATDYLQIHSKAAEKYNLKSPDPQLSYVPFNSKEGQDYYKAMKCAANYSFANKLMLTSYLIDTFEKLFGVSNRVLQFKTVYCIAHNICKLEKYDSKDGTKELIVHRKGATRSFPNTPVILAGSMGTSSYLLEGTENALEKSFGSAAHGAGRSMSRHRALREITRESINEKLKSNQIIVKTNSKNTLIEEAPDVYKNIDAVVEVITKSKLSKKIARMSPLIVIKG